MRLGKRMKTMIAGLTAIVLVLSQLLLASQAAVAGSGGGANWEKISPDLRAMLSSNATGSVNVIVQMKAAGSASDPQGAKKRSLDAKNKLEKNGATAVKSLAITSGASGSISLDRVRSLSLDPSVLYISYDTPLIPTGSPFSGDMVDFTSALNATDVWAKGIFGSGVTVAVIDSGVQPLPNGVDPKRLVGWVDLVNGSKKLWDPGGHGTHVAGIIAGSSDGWSGIAPQANIVSVRVTDNTGVARLSTVVDGIQWVVQNRKTYGIRVINISLGARAVGSYTKDPLAAAVEIAWLSGIVVVTSAGNFGPEAGTISTPGYDPFIVTVGALDMNATKDRGDDTVVPYSSRGPTVDGLTKPDVMAPGRKMVSTRVVGSYLDRLYPDRVVDQFFFRLSGTSQAAAAVSGVTALLLSSDPKLSPDQVKQRLMVSASKLNGYDANTVGAGYVDASRALQIKSVGARHASRPADAVAMLMYPVIKGKMPLVWKDLNYNGGVDSRGVPWSNLVWDNLVWDNLVWDNLVWDNLVWDNLVWDNLVWDNLVWDNLVWDNLVWDNLVWDNLVWDNLVWDNLVWDNLVWDNLIWDNVVWD